MVPNQQTPGLANNTDLRFVWNHQVGRFLMYDDRLKSTDTKTDNTKIK